MRKFIFGYMSALIVMFLADTFRFLVRAKTEDILEFRGDLDEETARPLAMGLAAKHMVMYIPNQILNAIYSTSVGKFIRKVINTDWTEGLKAAELLRKQ